MAKAISRCILLLSSVAAVLAGYQGNATCFPTSCQTTQVRCSIAVASTVASQVQGGSNLDDTVSAALGEVTNLGGNTVSCVGFRVHCLT
jgi:hypothetical protein